MEILEAMIGNEEEIEQWSENHRAAVAIYDAPIEEIENRIITLKRDRGADNAEQEERRIQSRLEEERRILEMQIKMKKKEKKNKEYSLLNDCKFSKTKLPNAHVRNITSLPQINNASSQKIHDFSGKLLCSVQALD